MTTAATAFPWHTLESIRKSDLARLRDLRATASHFVDTERLLEKGASILGAHVSARFRKLGAPKVRRDNDVAIVLSIGNATELLVEFEWAAVHRTIALGLGQIDQGIVLQDQPAEDTIGTFCALIAKALRTSPGNAAPAQIVAAGVAPIGDEWRTRHEGATTALFTHMIAEDAYDMRISFGEPSVAAYAPSPFSIEALEALGSVMISLPIVLATSTISSTELDSLAVGDAWLPGIAPLAEETAVVLAPSAAERGLSAHLIRESHRDGDAARVRFVGKRVELPWTIVVEESSMEANATEVLEEAQLVVRVEIGACEIAARDWAQLEAGDVLSLKQRIGEPAVLRVSGREVARGELVQIEGELGVRILSKVD